MWVRLCTYLLEGILNSSTHGGIGRRSGLKILCPLGTSEFDPRWVYMVGIGTNSPEHEITNFSW